MVKNCVYWIIGVMSLGLALGFGVMYLMEYVAYLGQGVILALPIYGVLRNKYPTKLAPVKKGIIAGYKAVKQVVKTRMKSITSLVILGVAISFSYKELANVIILVLSRYILTTVLLFVIWGITKKLVSKFLKKDIPSFVEAVKLAI